MKRFDFAKAMRLIEETKERLDSASLGMYEDWWWTAETIFENGEFTQNLGEIKKIAGIDGSFWATPAIQLCFADGNEEMRECFIEDGEQKPFEEDVATKAEQSAIWASGCMSAPAQDRLSPLMK